MPKGYRHLTYAERCQIHALRKSGHSNAAIARQLGRDRTTVSYAGTFPEPAPPPGGDGPM